MTYVKAVQLAGGVGPADPGPTFVGLPPAHQMAPAVLAHPGARTATPWEVLTLSKVVPSPNTATTYRGSVVKIRDSILEHSDLVFGLAGLRDLGPDADEAVARALEIPQLAVLRASWALVNALIDDEGEDAAHLFVEVMGERIYQRARYAVFGQAG